MIGRLGVPKAIGEQPFESVAHSMDALPGVGDISQYGVRLEDGNEISDEETERIRKKESRNGFSRKKPVIYGLSEI